MAVAGRILIMPKGDYDASVTYEMLDLITHNGSTWIAKKTSVGIEPTTENSEYWQKILGNNMLTVEQTLSFVDGVAEFTKNDIKKCQNVIVTAVGFEHAYCTQISVITEDSVTIQIKDISDETMNGDVQFRITYVGGY